VVRQATAVVVMLWLSLATACAPAAPTPTPEPTPTPATVLATKPEHLAGTWFDPLANHGGGMYHRFEENGTSRAAFSIEEFDNPDPSFAGTFWFENGLYHEKNPLCVGISVYEVYLQIEEGRAVRARMTVAEEPDPPCPDYRLGTQWKLVRAD
jgi:ABC-type transport system substrate-binding protein